MFRPGNLGNEGKMPKLRRLRPGIPRPGIGNLRLGMPGISLLTIAMSAFMTIPRTFKTPRMIWPMVKQKLLILTVG